MDAKLKEIDCSPECGFMIRSHDEKEVMEAAKMHMKKTHHQNTTDEEAKKMMKDAA